MSNVLNCVLIKTLTGAQALRLAFFGQGSGPIHLDDVRCTGSERRLVDCTYTPIDNCFHFEDAGVRCQGMFYS